MNDNQEPEDIILPSDVMLNIDYWTREIMESITNSYPDQTDMDCVQELAAFELIVKAARKYWKK